MYDQIDDNDVSLKLYKTDGKTEIAEDGEETLDLTNGKKLTLVPVADPVSVNDFVFETEGSMAIEYPLTLYGNGYGEGTLTISYKGKVLKTIKIDMGDAVARVGDKEYGDLQTAINAAPAEGVVELLKDIELDTTITVAEGMNVMLDLGNHTVTSSANPVIRNDGTLSVDGGDLGDGMVPGKLIATGVATVLSNYGTFGTIGGNLLVSAPNGDGMRIHNGTVGTIGGADSNVTVEARDYLVVVASGTTIDTIGGNGGTVTMTQNNEGGSIQYPFYVMGTVNSIGGTNADVTIKQTNRIKNFSATVFVTTATGKINSIGGEGATVNIIQNDQAGNPKNFQIAIWMNGGYIDTLGSGGTVNIVSNNTGVYFGGSTTSDVYINTIGAAGTVNFTGPVVDGKETSCKYGIRVNSSKHDKDIGVLGAGAEVNINASTYGVYVEKANSDIDRIATAGTVNINSESIGIYLETAGAKINTIGAGGTVNIEATGNAIKTNAAVTIDTIGKSGTVIIKSKAEAILVDGGGRINTIGGVNSRVTIDNTIGSNMNAIYIKDGSIGSIGSTGTGLVTIHAAQRGILVMSSTVDATKPTVESIGGPGGRVEISAGLKDTQYNACIYVASSNTLGTLGGENSQVIVYQKSKTSGDGAIYVGSGSTINNLGEGLIVATMTAGNYAVNAPGTIGLVSGGLYACDGRDKVFSKGANSQTYPAGYTLSNSTVSVTLPDRNVRECYYIVEKTAGTGTGAETPAPIGGFADAVAAYFAMADNSNSFVILTEDCTETADITLNGDLYLDLNSCELDISGIEFDLNGYDLYVIDSGTNGYLQIAQDVVGSIVGEIENGKQTGEVVAVYTVDRGANEGKTYVQVDGSNGLEFHRAAFSVTGIQFAFDSAANAGSGKGYLTFRGTLRGDEDVLKSLDALGISINDADVDWKEVTGAHGLHAYYTTSLASADAVKTVTGMMGFGGEYAPGPRCQVIPLLKEIKGKISESDLSDEQKALLEAYFSALE